ncbi:uncharacterized protein LOC112202032 isoform X2 [Rosa chinensis]|uniref:uncharacterized protein LOC112202032 isoform X2 n=1 Tax=Rosa chinensis TaxID=74649 RepID=UPI001AD8A0B1|nr:uncharacterized protein LOC112202032 isoform X2 [Rosa chinensis]
METELETETGCQSLKRRRSCAIDGLNSMSRFCTGFSAFEIGHRCVSSAKACCQLSEVQNKYRSCGVIISEFQTFDFNGIKARTATAVQTPEFQFEDHRRRCSGIFIRTLPGMSHRDAARHGSSGRCPAWFIGTLPGMVHRRRCSGMVIGDAAPACFFLFHDILTNL